MAAAHRGRTSVLCRALQGAIGRVPVFSAAVLLHAGSGSCSEVHRLVWGRLNPSGPCGRPAGGSPRGQLDGRGGRTTGDPQSYLTLPSHLPCSVIQKASGTLAIWCHEFCHLSLFCVRVPGKEEEEGPEEAGGGAQWSWVSRCPPREVTHQAGWCGGRCSVWGGGVYRPGSVSVPLPWSRGISRSGPASVKGLGVWTGGFVWAVWQAPVVMGVLGSPHPVARDTGLHPAEGPGSGHEAPLSYSQR